MPTPQIPMQKVESSQIDSIGFDPTTNTLAVRFNPSKKTPDKPGSLYHYSNFTDKDWEAFTKAESFGSHFGKHIKPFADKFPYKRIEEL